MTMNYADGGQYKGATENGKRQGKGEMTYANGDVYLGNWANDIRDTLGGENAVFTHQNSTYLGAWKDGHKAGVHTLTAENGSVTQVVEIDGKDVELETMQQ